MAENAEIWLSAKQMRLVHDPIDVPWGLRRLPFGGYQDSTVFLSNFEPSYTKIPT